MRADFRSDVHNNKYKDDNNKDNNKTMAITMNSNDDYPDNNNTSNPKKAHGLDSKKGGGLQAEDPLPRWAMQQPRGSDHVAQEWLPDLPELRSSGT